MTIETLFNEWLALSAKFNANPKDDAKADRQADRLAELDRQIRSGKATSADDVRRQVVTAFANTVPDDATPEGDFLGQLRRDLGLEEDERRLDLLLQARRESGLTLDFWADLTEGLDLAAVETLADRATLFPRHEATKAKD